MSGSPSRRSLLSMIGVVAGSAAMYHAMTELGYAQGSSFTGPIKLSPPPAGTTVLILGAGVAGMVAAMELRDAGYQVQVLEYNGRPGGRNWTLYGGDTYTELGGATQHVGFDPGQYINPGPWRLPYHHRGILHYASRLGVALEPFTQVNYNAYVHSTDAYGGKPQRYRQVQADFHGHVAELLSKCTRQNALDQSVSKQDQEILMLALRDWGALNENYEYKSGIASSMRRGFAADPGGGLKSVPVPSEPSAFSDLLQSNLWSAIASGHNYELQSAIFQPKGGMGMIGKAMGKDLGPLIEYNCKVTNIHQDDKGVTATYVDSRGGTETRTANAKWCICTIPTPILSQIPMNVGPKMRAAIDQLPYLAALKVGLQFKRRFGNKTTRSMAATPIPTCPIPPSAIRCGTISPKVRALCWAPTHSADPRISLLPSRRKSASRMRCPMAPRSIRSIWRSSRQGSRWPGIACRGRWAARVHGPMRAEMCTTTICARSTGASCWPASMRRACRDGRKAR